MFSRKNNKKYRQIDVDEIFMDSFNVAGYHRESMEGILEDPISKNVFMFLGAVFSIVAILFLSRIGFLQITKGDYLARRAENNYLREIIVEPERGIIFDRNKNVLTTNEKEAGMVPPAPRRRYPPEGFLHSIGFLTRKDNLFLSSGASGLEAVYDEVLKGTPGEIIEEINAKDEIVGSGSVVQSRPGGGLLTSLDAGLQVKLSESIKSTANSFGFTGGGAVVMNPETGEILAVSSQPDFDPNILISNPKKDIIKNLVNDPKKPFFNRAVSGLYPPGSIVKPAVAVGALAEGIIDSKKEILSSTPIVIKNPFFPDKPDIFPDWKQHGWVDMKKALAISSDIYFYTVGGGNGDQRGLGVWNLEKYFKEFGFGKKTGIDLPGEKDGFLPDPEKQTGDGRKWGIGDTYHLAIGQGDLQVTPVQMAFYASLLAGSGEAMYPHIVTAVLNKDNDVEEKFSYSSYKVGGVSKEIFNEVREGMRDAVRYGTAVGLSGYGIDIAAKTGTAEIGNTGRVHSWSIGFLPYENPKIAWAIVMENGSVHNTIGATFVASQMIQWMVENKFLESI